MDTGAVLRERLGRFAAKMVIAQTTCGHWPHRRRYTKQRADGRITKPRCVAMGFCGRIQPYLLAGTGQRHRAARAIRPLDSTGGGLA